jgi:two-component system, NarL family, sensor kinase
MADPRVRPACRRPNALTNIVRHAHATNAALSLDVSSRTVTLTIEDDGCGFDVERVQADPYAGVGLRNMRERLEALQGTLSLVSQAGRTVVKAAVPLPATTHAQASLVEPCAMRKRAVLTASGKSRPRT